MSAPRLILARWLLCTLCVCSSGAAGACAPRLAQNPAGRQVLLPLRPDADPATAIPPGVALEDGLTAEEAVAVALWNNAEFRVQLTDLGFARADLLEAGLLKNPILALLFPIGPKQLEATLRLPMEVLWERPRRVAAANRALDRVAAALEQHGLNLAADVKIAYVDLLLARDRAQLARDAAAQVEQIRKITEARLRQGDISELEARAATIDAARAAQDAVRAEFDAELRGFALRARLGLALEQPPVPFVIAAPRDDAPAASCADRAGVRADLVAQALASRPDVRAAEIAVEAAATRMGWERSRVLAVTAVLDANGAGKQGFEMGPGVELGLPLFDRNQAGRARASVEMQRAALGYVAARQRVAAEVDEALTQLSQARATVAAWRDAVVGPLAEQVRASERAYAAGDVSYLFVLENTRRLTDARLRGREVLADVARAVARLERAIGRTCSPTPAPGL